MKRHHRGRLSTWMGSQGPPVSRLQLSYGLTGVQKVQIHILHYTSLNWTFFSLNSGYVWM
jgi:hypothetical protein